MWKHAFLPKSGDTMKKLLWITLSYYLIQGIIHNLGHVVTPAYVNELGIPKYMFGFFFSAMSLGLVVGAPLWGILGDMKSKRVFVVIGLLGYSFGQIMFVSTENQVWMTFFRFFSGFSVSAAVTLLLSHVIALSPKLERTKYLSISAALLALGTTIGYLIGGFLGELFIKEVFYIQAVANALYALFIFITMKEVLSAKPTTKAHFFTHLKEAAHMDKSLLMFLFALTLATIAATNLTKYVDAYIIIDLGKSTSTLGIFVMITGIVGMFTNFVIVPLMTKLRRDFLIMKWLQIGSAIIIFFVFRANNVMLALYTLYMLYVVLKSIFQPLEQNYISLNAKDEKYGSIMGVRQIFFSIGMVIGPLLSGFLYDYNPLLVFNVSAGMFILAFILLTLSQNALKKQKRAQDTIMPHELEAIEYRAAP